MTGGHHDQVLLRRRHQGANMIEPEWVARTITSMAKVLTADEIQMRARYEELIARRAAELKRASTARAAAEVNGRLKYLAAQLRGRA